MINFSTLQQWLTWLESLKIIRSQPKALENLKTIAENLSLLPFPHRVITITGTNGKGSCAALLESVYASANYKVGTFTSPHLLQFNERIRIQKQNAGNENICSAFNAINQARGKIELNYFQFSFLAALIIFKQCPLDIVILEAGIGGKHDAVNLIDSDLSIITNVELDHCDVLGKTREEIGMEKAGIMRKFRPAVYGDSKSPPNSLLSSAKQLCAKLYCYKKDYFYLVNKHNWSFHGLKTQLENLPFPQILLKNAAAALTAVEILNKILPVGTSSVISGLKNLHILGRCQVIDLQGIKLLVDVAHNPSAAKILRDKLLSLNISGKIYAIVGMLKEKDIRSTLKCFIQTVDQWFVTNLNTERSAGQKQLADELKNIGVSQIQCYDNPKSAFNDALKYAKKNDLLVIFGSFLTVSQIFVSLRDGFCKNCINASLQ